MILGIHQPQYIPWPAYFMKIRRCEKFVILDSVDYQKNGIQNRNMIKTSNGSSWLTVPVSRKTNQKIFETQINNNIQWRKKHWQSIYQSYNKSEYFQKYSPEIEEFYSRDWTNLSELNIFYLKAISKWMNLDTDFILASEMCLNEKGSELILEICKKVGAKKYISGMGGKDYIIEKNFLSSGIEIDFIAPELPSEYSQNYMNFGYLNDLSVLDLLFNCGDQWLDYF